MLQNKVGRRQSPDKYRFGLRLKVALLAFAGALTIATIALANPQGGDVVSGSATISTPTPSTTQVTQTSEKAIINWQSFNINSNESTVFVQPGTTSIALNRIFDSNPSVVAGLLSANGRLILVNRNGMMFESGATIDTAGLIASSADISNENFLADRFVFDIAGNPGARISNAGSITARPTGVVAIVAPSVENSGIITAKMGRIGLGAGSTFVLDLQGENLINFPINAELAERLLGANGSALADGSAHVLLSSAAARSIIDEALKLPGDSIANNILRNDGSIFLTGPGGATGTVTLGGKLDVSGAHGGSIQVSGGNVLASGQLLANGTNGNGGSVSITAGQFASLAGSISATGLSGGSVSVTANDILSAGRIDLDAAYGSGGSVSLEAANRQIATSSSNVTANGASKGGSIAVSGGQGLFTSGTYAATASTGTGGNVAFGGRDIKLIDAHVDASGATGGGKVAVGFTDSGTTRSIGADNILVSPTSIFHADATQTGNGGSVVFWSNLSSDFMGTITAKGGSFGGDGGMLEVSSKGDIGFWGLGDASAVNGHAGTLSLDPKNLIVSAAGTMMPSYQLIDPTPSAGNQFANTVVALSSGHTVVTASQNDFGASNTGSVYVFNTVTGALVSTLTGSTANDQVGSGGVTLLSSGNFVVASSNWDNGAATDAGAATFGNGTTGVSGVVSAANSLVGTASTNQVANGGVTALSNGNYAVVSSNWDNGGTSNAGAVTWGNGTSGTVGAVSAANSLIGSQTNDNVGSAGVVALTNGNYVVRSTLWNNGGTVDAGAATWGNGLGGTVGAVTAANSLVGSATNDNVSNSGVTALTNGNYVVASSLWNNGANTDAGAATWGNGLGGTVGTISAANSFLGGVANNNVGSGGVVALSNGHYVIVSPSWDNLGFFNIGAVTWGDGVSGSSGIVGTGNSLYGPNAGDIVGSGGVYALNNGNYVVNSPNVDTVLLGSGQGAVTWRSGTSGSGALVTAANSLFGSSHDDAIGSSGIVVLSNGNYVVVSPNWNNGVIIDAGAVTWGDGLTGTTGNVGAGNSTIGTVTNDFVGSGGAVALNNGNYVIASPLWNNGGIVDAGAVTWRNGGAAAAGTLSAANSLVGSSTNDNVGNGGAVALTNGNYVVRSRLWNNGATADVGAVTWGSGTTGVAGTISAANSLIGSVANDQVGSGNVLAISGGRYLVSSPLWNNGGSADAGAVTLSSAAGDTVGAITSANSLIGLNAGAQLSATGLAANGEILARSTASGFVLVGLTDPNQLTFARAQGQTLTVNPAFLTRTLNTGTAVSLQASNDVTVSSDIIANNPGGNGGALTLQAGRSVLINANITTDNGNLTIVANELLANGVVDLQRDPGAAQLSMGAGTTINAGTGDVRLTIASGAGKTNAASGDLTLRNIVAGTLVAENLGPSNGNVAIAAGSTLSTSGAGTPLVLASQGGNFVNSAGAGALSTPNGRWIVYSQNAGANTPGGLVGNPYYNTPYNPSNPTGVAAAGNRFAYTLAPSLTVAANNASRLYGAADPVFTYGISGFINGDNPLAAVSGAAAVSTIATPSSSVSGGPYAITPSLGTLASDFNYGFAFVNGALTIDPATLAITANSFSKTYGQTVNFAGTEFTSLGLQNGETIGSVALASLGAAPTANVAGSPYAITASSATGGTFNAGNYLISYTNGALTVDPAALAITANSFSKTYGQTVNFAGTEFSAPGLQNGETIGSVTLASLGAVNTANVSGSPYVITASNATGGTFNPGNYLISYVNGALTVDPATLTYIADPKTRLYGGANPALTGSVTGFQNSETIATATTGALTFSTLATPTTNVGNHAITGSGLAANNGNYLFVQALGNATALTIDPATLAITANSFSKTYGQTVNFAGTEFTSLGLQNGETIGSVALASLGAAPTANVAGSPYAITASNASGGTFNAGNYLISYTNGALTVDPAALAITANSFSKTYGQTVNFAGTEFSAPGLQNGETIGSVTLASLGAVNTANVSGSPYVITASNATGGTFNPGNYLISYVNGALTVDPATLTYIADPKTRLYGGANPALTGSVTGFQNGETIATATTGALTFSTLATPTTNVGSHAITGSGLAANNGNYLFVQALGNATALTIDPATLAITANSFSKTYGQTVNFAGTEFTSLGLQNGETIGSVALASLGAAPTANVAGSPYAITASNATGGTFNAGNYLISYTNGALTVDPAALAITANSFSKTYGQTVNFAGTEFTSLGLQNGETIGSVALASLGAAPTANVAGSPYAITASSASGGTFNAGNYLISYTNGALTVDPAALAITANSFSKTYGQTVNFAGTEFTSLGLQNGETIGSVALASLGAAPTANVAGSPYAITASNATGGTFNAGNYLISYTNGALTVDPATLAITANSFSKTYGQTVNFAGTEFSALGLQNGETIGSVALASLGAAPTANVAGSPYAITASSATGGTFNAGNYLISYTNGALTVDPAALAITANSFSKTYGQTVNFAGTEFSAPGLQNGETIGSVTLASLGAVNTANVSGSPYVITASNATGGTFNPGNYLISYVNGALTVDPATLTYIADPKTRLYGGANPALTGSVTGFQNSETIATATTGALTFSTLATPTTNVGNHAITGSGLAANNGNYLFVQALGNATALTIDPATLAITANSFSKTYGQTVNFAGTEFTSLGLQNGETIGSVALASLGAAPTANVAGSPYAITASNASGGTFNAGNYLISYTNGALTVDPAALAITANSFSKTYGQTVNFAGTEFSAPGLQNGETIGSVTLASLGAVNTANVSGSPYVITASNATGGTFNPGNYLISYVNGALTVDPATLTYIADPKTRLYGGANPALTGSVTGFQNGETIATATTGALTFSTLATPTTNVGSHAITGSGLAANNGNYLFVQALGNATALTIDPATLTYVADPKTRLFATANPALTGTVTGFQNGETIGTATTGALAFTTPATLFSAVGSYAINGSGLNAVNGNYLFVQAATNSSALTIDPNPAITNAPNLVQVLLEGDNSGDDAEWVPRGADLGINGPQPVSSDLDDGEHDDTLGQMCVLGATKAQPGAKCEAAKAKH